MKIIDFPSYRQTFRFDCGAEALHSVLAYYGIDTDEINIIKLAGTNEDTGTPLHGMEKVARHFGLECMFKTMTVEEIRKHIDEGLPVILLLQAWPTRKIKDWRRTWKDGHYVVAIGYDREKIYFDDPGYCMRTFLSNKELMERWHDFDSEEGKKHEDLGIIIKGRTRRYSSKEVVHMD